MAGCMQLRSSSPALAQYRSIAAVDFAPAACRERAVEHDAAQRGDGTIAGEGLWKARCVDAERKDLIGRVSEAML